MRPISGERKPLNGEMFHESSVLGNTGQFVKGAAIVCGGKNNFDNLNTCYEYKSTENQ